MNIPSAHPEDAPGVGPSSQPLEERLISPGGGSGVPPTLIKSFLENLVLVPLALSPWALSSVK